MDVEVRASIIDAVPSALHLFPLSLGLRKHLQGPARTCWLASTLSSTHTRTQCKRVEQQETLSSCICAVAPVSASINCDVRFEICRLVALFAHMSSMHCCLHSVVHIVVVVVSVHDDRQSLGHTLTRLRCASMMRLKSVCVCMSGWRHGITQASKYALLSCSHQYTLDC